MQTMPTAPARAASASNAQGAAVDNNVALPNQLSDPFEAIQPALLSAAESREPFYYDYNPLPQSSLRPLAPQVRFSSYRFL